MVCNICSSTLCIQRIIDNMKFQDIYSHIWMYIYLHIWIYVHIIYVYLSIIFCKGKIFISQNEISNGVVLFYVLLSSGIFAQKIVKFALYFIQLYSRPIWKSHWICYCLVLLIWMHSKLIFWSVYLGHLKAQVLT